MTDRKVPAHIAANPRLGTWLSRRGRRRSTCASARSSSARASSPRSPRSPPTPSDCRSRRPDGARRTPARPGPGAHRRQHVGRRSRARRCATSARVRARAHRGPARPGLGDVRRPDPAASTRTPTSPASTAGSAGTGAASRRPQRAPASTCPTRCSAAPATSPTCGPGPAPRPRAPAAVAGARLVELDADWKATGGRARARRLVPRRGRRAARPTSTGRSTQLRARRAVGGARPAARRGRPARLAARRTARGDRRSSTRTTAPPAPTLRRRTPSRSSPTPRSRRAAAWPGGTTTVCTCGATARASTGCGPRSPQRSASTRRRSRCEHAENAGCYGHNAADDAAFDAVLLARAVPGRPVQVRWSRRDELTWAPFSSAMTADVSATLDDGRITGWTYDVWSQGHTVAPRVPGHARACSPAPTSPEPSRSCPPDRPARGRRRRDHPQRVAGLCGRTRVGSPVTGWSRRRSAPRRCGRWAPTSTCSPSSPSWTSWPRPRTPTRCGSGSTTSTTRGPPRPRDRGRPRRLGRATPRRDRPRHRLRPLQGHAAPTARWSPRSRRAPTCGSAG